MNAKKAFCISMLVLLLAGRASAQPAPGQLITINGQVAPTAPTEAHVGDMIVLQMASANVTAIASTLASGTALVQVGLFYDPAAGTYEAYYSAANLGSCTVTFTYALGGASPTTNTFTLNVVPVGVQKIVDVNLNTGAPNPIHANVGDLIRLTYTGVLAHPLISSIGPSVRAAGTVSTGTTFIAYFSAISAGTQSTIAWNPGTGGGTIFQVSVP